MFYIGVSDIDQLFLFAEVSKFGKEDKAILNDYFSGMSEEKILKKYPDSNGYGNKPMLHSLVIGKIYYGLDFVSDSDPTIYYDHDMGENFPVYVVNVFQDKKEAYTEFYSGFKTEYGDNIQRSLIKASFIKGVENFNII